MNVQWKELGTRIHPRRWSGMAWTVAAMVVMCSIATAIVGVKLFEITDRQTVYFNTK